MNSKDIINELKKLVENQCKESSNVFGYESWTHHINIVYKYSMMLSDKLKADKEIVQISALLHDIASVTDINMYKDHHIHGANMAENILKKYNYPINKIAWVKKCILSHRGSVLIAQGSVEEVCVSSADAMAHIDQLPSLLHLAYAKKNLQIDEGSQWVKNKLSRSWNKLCPEAKELIRHKYNCANELLA
jgi:uncharacterized protein